MMLLKFETRVPLKRGIRILQSVRKYSQHDKVSSVDREEIEKFSQQSSSWWDERGDFAALHTMNKLRIPLIKESFSKLATDTPTPLSGKTILDVGCGGGILSEPLARLGASVTGIDAAEKGIKAATGRRDSLREPLLDRNLDYQCANVEDFIAGREETFDLVVASEVVEHVTSLDTFIDSCVQLIKPGGSMVVTTINRTQLSYYLTIVAAENIFGIVARGTHDWNKYVKPAELQQTFEKYRCSQTLLHGMSLNIITLQWSWINSTDINYAARFVKHKR